MPPVVRKGDICTGHGCFPPRNNSSWSPNVFANNKNVHRKGDSWVPHKCGKKSHGSNLAAGSPNVFANNKAIGRIGDPVACGSSCATGSPNVFAN